jgi:hypothetical protein
MSDENLSKAASHLEAAHERLAELRSNLRKGSNTRGQVEMALTEIRYAMQAVPPVPAAVVALVKQWRDDSFVMSLQSQRAMLVKCANELEAALGATVVPAEAEQAREYLGRLLTHYAPQCEPLPDLLGVVTQIDNLLAGMPSWVAQWAPPTSLAGSDPICGVPVPSATQPDVSVKVPVFDRIRESFEGPAPKPQDSREAAQVPAPIGGRPAAPTR